MAKQNLNATTAGAVASLINDCRQVLAVPGTKPEVSLYTQFENFLVATLGQATSGSAGQFKFVQQTNADALGVPDFRVLSGHELQGWVEVKAVLGKDLTKLAGHDADQRDRFKFGLDNVIFTTGWQWRLYQHNQQVGRDVILGPPTIFDPQGLPFSVAQPAIAELVTLLDAFRAAKAQSYATPAAAVTALAARAKALKLALVQTGPGAASPHLLQLRDDFRALLFKNGLPFTWERFVDSYVQLAVFGALLWRLETGQNVDLTKQVGVDVNLHPLLAQCLAILWSPQSRTPILEPLLEELCRSVNAVPPPLFTPPAATGPGGRRYVPDPIVHAYEPFFEAYDPAARESAGVYYTPVEIVSHIVSGIGAHLRSALNRPDGLLDSDAQFLDPATGTGTFLLGLANGVAAEAAGAGLPQDQMVKQVLTKQASAFELFPGPYAIAHQRLEVALKSLGATPSSRLPIYLADTLAAPTTGTLPTSGFGIAGVEIEHERQSADKLKTAEKILVILGNPPYERVLETQGGQFEPFAQGLLTEIRNRTPQSHRADLKSTKDLFVAFWAWAIWALQSPQARAAGAAIPQINPSDCHGLIGFITNRTWIIGRSLIGLREMVRQGAKEIWILDLGGDQRGAHGAKSFAGGDANVFGIRTGVAIAWVVFDRSSSAATTVHYRRLFGNRSSKLAELSKPFDPSLYEAATGSGGAPLMPNRWGTSPVGSSPTIDSLFSVEPETGLQTARDKSRYAPIGTEAGEVLAETTDAQGNVKIIGRLGDWSRIPKREDRFNEWATAQSKRANLTVPARQDLKTSKLRRYMYRPLDMRWIYDDPSWVDWWRPRLHDIYALGDIWSLVTIPRDHGNGPTVVHTETLMDQHSFRGSDGGKGVFSLWIPHVAGDTIPDPRTELRTGMRCAFTAPVYDWLDGIRRQGRVQDAYDYILAVLSAPDYAKTYWQALEVDPLRIPLTKDATVFDAAVALGKRLRLIWTLRVPKHPTIAWQGTLKHGKNELGKASWAADRLTFENGRELVGVSQAAWTRQVSNYPLLKNWFAARKQWTATPTQAKEAMDVVSSAQEFVDIEAQLNGLLQAAEATA